MISPFKTIIDNDTKKNRIIDPLQYSAPIHIQYERFLSGIGGGDDAIAIGYLSRNRCHVARDDMIAISASNVVG